MKIEELDTSMHEEETTLIVGRSVVIKATASSEKETPADLSELRTSLSKRPLKELANIFNEIKKHIDDKKGCIQRLQSLDNAMMDYFQDIENNLKHGGFGPMNLSGFMDIMGLEDFDPSKGPEQMIKIMFGEEKFEELETRFKDPQFSNKIRPQLLKGCGRIDFERLKIANKQLEESLKDLGIRSNPRDVLYYCSNCYSIFLSSDEVSCRICKSSCSTATTEMELSQLSPASRFFVQGRWLEEWVESSLKSAGWNKIWTNMHVLGGSGVTHEVDVLGVNGDMVLVVECKTGKSVPQKDINNFLAKLNDLKATRGLFCSLAKADGIDLNALMRRAPNLLVVDNMIDLTRDDMVSKLQEIA